MLTILERLRAHCFPTTYKTLFISKPEQHHRMTRHHYCPCNNSWIELYAFFCQPLPKLQLVSRCGRFIATYGANSFFLHILRVHAANQIFQAWWLVKLQWNLYFASYLNYVVPSCKAFSKNVDIHLNRAQAGRSRLTACVSGFLWATTHKSIFAILLFIFESYSALLILK